MESKLNYHELSQEEYTRRTAEPIAEIEGFKKKPYYVADDGKATIGCGYTFNRNNNVALWEQAGISLTEDDKKYLQSIDAEKDDSKKTQLGLAFPREITQDEAARLLQASIPKYEGPANDLGMPYSTERAALVAVTYNRGPCNVNANMQPFLEAVKNGDRAEAYYQLRYQSWGTNPAGEKGVRKARAMEAQMFGQFDDPANVTPAEAENVYNTFKKHRDDIQHLEAKWGVDLNGVAADSKHDVVAMANRDYPNAVAAYGDVPTIRQALEPAKTQYLNQLREQFPAQANQLTDRAYWTGAIHVAPDSNGAPQLTIDESKIALHRGDRGVDVQALQEQLAALHYPANDKQKPLMPDGKFGSDTTFAISAFQKEHQLTVSGVADAATKKALHEAAQIQKQGSNQQLQDAAPTQNAPAQNQGTSPAQFAPPQPAPPLWRRRSAAVPNTVSAFRFTETALA